MADPEPSSPKAVPIANPAPHFLPPDASPSSRAASIARLGSPVPSHQFGTPPVRQIPTPSQLGHGHHLDSATPLAGTDKTKLPASGGGESVLAAALRASGTPPRFSTPPLRASSPASPPAPGSAVRSNYGSFDHRDAAPAFLKDELEIVKRHLAGPMSLSTSPGRKPSDHHHHHHHHHHHQQEADPVAPGFDDDEFSSLRLQGGDVTRPIYRLVEQQEAEAAEINRRKSFYIDRPPPEDETQDINAIMQPGGFRRDYLRRTAASPSPSNRISPGESSAAAQARLPHILTTSFIEFLSLYGHFAGEDLEDIDEETDDYFTSDAYDDAAQGEHNGDELPPGETSALLGTPGKRKRRRKEVKHGASSKGAALLLLKSFVGTGVLFLPKAFLNGGMLFSSLVLLFVSAISYYCFLLLVSTRAKVPASFGGMGFRLYGKSFRALINFSLVISQIGFSSAYIVFVSENLQAFILAVTDCKTFIPVKYLILMQMVIFLPLSLYRNIQNIQKIAIVADIFILLGLLYLYYYDILTLSLNHGIADIALFNKNDWTLFIGTAIFTFEGIGLIIPIQESMEKPHNFPGILGMVMIIITIIFTSMGALSYAAYGSKTKTVVILNMPQDSKFVNAVQFIYSLAILLSTPLQFFPAIEITSKAIFKKTGRGNPLVKWKKNIFRFLMVVICALIAWAGADDLDKFVAIVGSFACIPLVYIYPVGFISASAIRESSNVL
jgi:solute carrier family 36 (proton-coupled amino acid transporter)